MNKAVIKDVSVRLVALFVSTSIGIITGTGVLSAFTHSASIPIWIQALQAGGASVALVVLDLAKALNDGKLDKHEVDAAFGIDRSKHGEIK